MYYYCVENNQICSVSNYEPNVPESVSVYEVPDDIHERIQNKEWWFNLETRTAEPLPDSVAAQLDAVKSHQEKLTFLSKTDWQVLRHLRQKALGLPTTLEEWQYLDLEFKREQTARSI